MVKRGFEILVTQVASDGLMNWLGRKITADNFEQLAADSRKYGFHIGFEGGYADTLVVDAPIFPQRLEIVGMTKVVDDAYCGHVVLETVLKEKQIVAARVSNC